MIRGFRNVLFGGEGLFLATLTGPGHVALQSMPIMNLAEEIGRYLPGRTETTATAGGLAATGVVGGIMGGLFGNQDLKNNRTELVLFITPRVVETEFDTRRFIDDLRRKMERLDDVFPRQKTAPEDGSAP